MSRELCSDRRYSVLCMEMAIWIGDGEMRKEGDASACDILVHCNESNDTISLYVAYV